MAVTIKEIAKMAGVSHGTVSDILNDNGVVLINIVSYQIQE